MSKEFAFKKGWVQVKHVDVITVKKRIMEALNLKTRASFYQRMHGKIEPKVSEAKAIEKIFADYGIKNVWGE